MTRWSKVLALALALAPLAPRAESVVSERWWQTYPMPYDAVPQHTRVWQVPMGVDASGNVFLMTSDGVTISMVKFGADGQPSWRHDTAIPEGYFELFGMGVDARGVPFFGLTYGIYGQLVVRLDPVTGAVLTSTTVAPPAGFESLLGYDLAADVDGNLFTASEGRWAGGGADGFVAVKVDTAGAVAWSSQWTPAYYSWSPRIGVDHHGDLVLHGDVWRWFGTGMDPVGGTAKFDGQTGAILWTATYYGLPNRGRQGEHLLKVGFDADDGIYLAGSQDSADSGSNYLAQWPTVVKYDKDGALRWEAVDTTWKGWWFRSLVTDAAGAAYVTAPWDGSSGGTGGDCVVARYLPDGTQSWFLQYDGQESGDDSGCMLAADGVGGVYLAFSSSFLGRGGDASVLRLDPATGAVVWRAFSGSTLVSRPAFGPQAMAASANGILAVHGKPGSEMGVLEFGPAPAPAALVAPTPVARLAASGKGSAVVAASLAASRPEVACNVTGGGTPFNALNVRAGASGTFLFRPQVAATGYQATCYYDGPAGVGSVTATLTLRFDQGANITNSKLVPVAFDGTATHQAVTVALDASLAGLNFSNASRLWVFDGVDSVDPDSGRIAAYRWEVRDAKGALVATLSGRGVPYRFPASGSYDVRLVVTDDDGATAQVTTRVTP